MEVQLNETSLDCRSLVMDQVLRREQSVECVVPDTLPDIASIVSTCGTALIRSKDVESGKVHVDANIPARVVCRAEDGTLFCLEVNLPFAVTAEQAEITEKCLCVADLALAALDTRALNPRKVTVRAELCVTLRCYAPGHVAFFTAPENCGNVHLQERESAITTVCAVTEKTFVLTDEYVLGADAPDAEKILCQRTAVHLDETRILGEKCVIKGSVKSTLIYLDAAGTPAAAEFTTAFSQLAEPENLPEDAAVTAVILPSGVYYDSHTGGETRSIGMEVHLVAQLTVRGKNTARYIADAYSNLFPLTVEQTDLELSSLERTAVFRETLQSVVETPSPVGEVLKVCAVPGAAEYAAGAVIVPVTVQIFYRSMAGELCAVKRCCPVKFAAASADGEWPEITDALVQEPLAVPAQGGVEVRIPMELNALVFADKTVSAVTAIDCDEAAPRDFCKLPSLTLMRVSGDCDLWEIAKENCSTVEAIRSANKMGEAESVGEFLLVPKMQE